MHLNKLDKPGGPGGPGLKDVKKGENESNYKDSKKEKEKNESDFTDIMKLNETSGFDFKDLKNAKQNNYAWSMAELGDYIYVGTGKNIGIGATGLLVKGLSVPLLIKSSVPDNMAEIWRYKKDGSMPWTRVYKSSKEEGIAGFRYMINHKSKNSSEALYAAGLAGSGVLILKSTDGSNWTKVSNNMEGKSSRAMASFNGNLYVACIGDNALGGKKPLLYYSEDPEFFEFKSILNSDDKNFIEGKNPTSGIADIEVFNDKLYATVSGNEGLEVWRTNSSEVKMNDWTLVVDKGFGDSMNNSSIGIGVFRDYLYISSVKELPLALLVPMGSEMIRIDKDDKWELIVGGTAIKPTKPTTGTRTESLSGYKAGFSNPFNLYIWQIQSYDNMLIASTFDHGSNIEVLRDMVLLNKDLIVKEYGVNIYNLILKIYNIVLSLFAKYNYPRGFDLFVSKDGEVFNPVTLNGLGNGNNYGGRILLVDSKEDLYIGTANPYDGCEIFRSTDSNSLFMRTMSDEEKVYLKNLSEVESEILQIRNSLIEELKQEGKLNL